MGSAKRATPSPIRVFLRPVDRNRAATDWSGCVGVRDIGLERDPPAFRVPVVHLVGVGLPSFSPSCTCRLVIEACGWTKTNPAVMACVSTSGIGIWSAPWSKIGIPTESQVPQFAPARGNSSSRVPCAGQSARCCSWGPQLLTYSGRLDQMVIACSAMRLLFQDQGLADGPLVSLLCTAGRIS